MLLEVAFEALSLYLAAFFFRSIYNIYVSQIKMIIYSFLYGGAAVFSGKAIELIPFSAMQMVKTLLILVYCIVFMQLIFKAKITRTITYIVIALMLNGLANVLALIVFKVSGIGTKPRSYLE